MDSPQIASTLEKVLPVITFFAGLFADWFRQQLTTRAEERRHIARVISELLDVRHRLLVIRELPKIMPTMFPKEIGEQIPAEFWQSIDFSLILPADDKLGERYRKAVDEIAGFKPVLAYQLRGKEIYFDVRNGISNYFSQIPGSPPVANQITGILDREYLPVIEETLLLLAKCHSMRTGFEIKRKLRRRDLGRNVVSPEIKQFFKNLVEQLPKTDGTQTQPTPRAPKESPPYGNVR